MINETLLEQLSPEQVQLAGSLLERIFLHQESLQTASDEQVFVLGQLFEGVKSDVIRKQLFQSLKGSVLDRFLGLCGFESKEWIIHSSSDDQIAIQVFESLSDTEKKGLLIQLSIQESPRYSLLKNLMTQKTNAEGNGPKLTLQKSTPEKKQQELLQLIQKSSLTPDQFSDIGKQLSQAYDTLALEAMLVRLVSTFNAVNIPMNTPKTFAMHLRLYFLIDEFINIYPSLQKPLAVMMESLVAFLKDLPEGPWVVKILNQFPVYYLKFILGRLARYERIPSFEKRNLYCKLFNDNKQNLNIKESKQVRFALSQI